MQRSGFSNPISGSFSILRKESSGGRSVENSCRGCANLNVLPDSSPLAMNLPFLQLTGGCAGKYRLHFSVLLRKKQFCSL